MSPTSTLHVFRLYRKWEPEFVAGELNISLQEYNDLESGRVVIDSEKAIELSSVFQCPPHLFLSSSSKQPVSVIYYQCEFNNSNGYVHNSYKTNLGSDSNILIDLMKDEIESLRKQNNKLIELLKQNVNTNAD